MELKSIETLKPLLQNSNPAFWELLNRFTCAARDFDELFLLSSLRKKAHARQLPRPGVVREKIRVAVMGGCSLYPFHELLEHFCEAGRIMARCPRASVRAPRIMADVYRAILASLEERGFAPPRQRVRTPRHRVLLAILRYGLF